MKEFCCGDVVPGCGARFRAATDDEILAEVAVHARNDHGITEVTQGLVAQIQEHIRPVAA